MEGIYLELHIITSVVSREVETDDTRPRILRACAESWRVKGRRPGEVRALRRAQPVSTLVLSLVLPLVLISTSSTSLHPSITLSTPGCYSYTALQLQSHPHARRENGPTRADANASELFSCDAIRTLADLHEAVDEAPSSRAFERFLPTSKSRIVPSLDADGGLRCGPALADAKRR